MTWKPGDRVTIILRDDARRGRGVLRVPVNGTVTAVDEEGLPPGVRVQLDRTVNGADNCYATHRELSVEAPDV